MSADRGDRQTSVDELPDAATANNFSPEIADLYQRNFQALRRDAQARPGLASLQSMSAERAAHTHARIKAMDSGPVAYPPDYDRANQTFLKAAQQIMASAKPEDDFDAERKLLYRTVMRLYVEQIEALPISDDEKIEVLNDFEAMLAAGKLD